MTYWQHRRTAGHAVFREARDLLLAHRSDHETAAELFRWPRPAHFNWALEWFDVIAAENEQTALHLLTADGPGERVSYARLSAESDRTASWLRDSGVAAGDRILIVIEPQRELWEIMLACLKVGAVVVPTYTSLTAFEAADRIERGNIRHVVCQDELTALIPGNVPGLRVAVPGNSPGWTPYRDREDTAPSFLPGGPTPADNVAFCYFTSGTTAAPKLVAHTHVSYPVGHLSSLFWNGLQPGDRHVNLSAPGWAKHSWSSLFVPWNAEATILVLPPGPVDHAALPTLLRNQQVNSFCAPPSSWQAVRPYLGTARPMLREAVSAGEPLPEQLVRDVAQHWGITIREGYGQSETTALIGTCPGSPARPGWLGRPLPGWRITLRGEDGSPAEHSGEICLDLQDRPVGLMSGSSGEDGLYRTGDLGERDDKGWFRLIGRRDDVFKSFGHRVSPYELEAVLQLHPAVSEAAVVPVPHPVGGNVPHAVVVRVLGTSAGEAELLRHCSEHLTPELQPRSISFTDLLPRTVSGKIRRSVVRIPDSS
jgi:acetyl-CoA synthetase